MPLMHRFILTLFSFCIEGLNKFSTVFVMFLTLVNVLYLFSPKCPNSHLNTTFLACDIEG